MLTVGSEISAGSVRAEVLAAPSRKQQAYADQLYVGLTGGIGAGKSAVASALANCGSVVIDADQLAREVVEPGTPGLDAIAEHFGYQMVSADGSLDRRALGELVFSDSSARFQLEQITHPLIAARVREIAEAAPAGSVIVYDVPLLVEKWMESQFDLVVVVDAPLEDRLERLELRGLSRDAALGRINAQARDFQRRAVADVWIDNAGSVTELNRVVARVCTEWLLPLA